MCGTGSTHCRCPSTARWRKSWSDEWKTIQRISDKIVRSKLYVFVIRKFSLLFTTELMSEISISSFFQTTNKQSIDRRKILNWYFTRYFKQSRDIFKRLMSPKLMLQKKNWQHSKRCVYKNVRIYTNIYHK